VIVFSRPRALALFTGRRVSAGFRSGDPCALWQYLHGIGAAYVITGPDNDPFNGDAADLRRFVSAFRDDFTVVMANHNVAVYRINRYSCSKT